MKRISIKDVGEWHLGRVSAENATPGKFMSKPYYVRTLLAYPCIPSAIDPDVLFVFHRHLDERALCNTSSMFTARNATAQATSNNHHGEPGSRACGHCTAGK
jgi:hypothetical protein